MSARKLSVLLSRFKPAELNRFKRYLSSPYFNESEELFGLFQLLHDQLRAGQPELSRTEIWRALYPSQPFDDAKIRRMLSELTNHAFDFLAIEDFRAEKQWGQVFLLERFNDEQLEKHFQGICKKASKSQDQRPYRDAAYHFFQNRIEQARYNRDEVSAQLEQKKQQLESADYHLDAHFFTQKLRYYCEALSFENIFSVGMEVSLPEGLLGYLAGVPLQREPSVRAFYLAVLMFLHPQEEERFRALKDFLTKNGRYFPAAELRILYTHLNNYCVHYQINTGNSDYFRELFENFQLMLREDIIVQNGALSFQDYKNIITVGLHIQAFEWVEAFIQDYTSKLPAVHQENALNYNLAKVYFHQQKYDQVIEQLRDVEYQAHVYALGSKLMLLKTYFEKEEYLALDSLAESFKIYLRRNKTISRDVRQQYLNWLRFVKRLSNLPPGDRTGLQKIRQQIDDCKALADKGWILEKVVELAG